MSEREDIVIAVIAAAGGRLTGRVRLQKVVYLLDQLGLSSELRFSYHHYGPFSDDLAHSVEAAKASGTIEEELAYRQSDGIQYSVFSTIGEADLTPFESMGRDRAQAALAKLLPASVTVLELAATAHWLWQHEKVSDWKAEIRRRKGVKTADGRLEKAIALLGELGLPPPADSAAQSPVST